LTVWLEVLGLNCQSCSEAAQQDRGCDEGSSPGQYFLERLNQEFDSCPGKHATEQSRMYIDAFFFFKQGYFPNQGGWMDQPVKLLQAFKVITAEVEEVNEWRKRKGTDR